MNQLLTTRLHELDRHFSGLIFDCDGTLSDSMPLHYEAWREAMERYGIVFPEERFYAMGGMPSDKIIALLSSEQGVTVDAVAAAELKETLFEQRIDQLEPLHVVCDIARRFHGRLPMAVASGGIRRVVQKQLSQMAIEHLFVSVVAAEDTARHKPEPDVFLEAARRLGVPPSACLVFEDAELGFQAAAAAGMQCIDVRTMVSVSHLDQPTS